MTFTLVYSDEEKNGIRIIKCSHYILQGFGEFFYKER